MAHSETLKISIGAIIKDLEMLWFVPDHLKNKKMCKHAVKKVLFLIKYVLTNARLKQYVIKLF